MNNILYIRSLLVYKKRQTEHFRVTKAQFDDNDDDSKTTKQVNLKINNLFFCLTNNTLKTDEKKTMLTSF